jgi:hypothetical protein
MVTGIAMTGLAATALAVVVFWLLLTSAQSAAVEPTPAMATLVWLGHWFVHAAHRVSAWL